MDRRTLLLPADITAPYEVEWMYAQIAEAWSYLDLLVLNASGGLEKDKPKDYAMRLNRDAQLSLVENALPFMASGGRIVFVTSHLAHFSGTKPVPGAYEPVARSKRAGEDALRDKIPELACRGISCVVVSGDLIEGTITPKLLQRSNPGLIENRRREVGTLPTAEEFADAIVQSALSNELHTGQTVYVGRTD